MKTRAQRASALASSPSPSVACRSASGARAATETSEERVSKRAKGSVPPPDCDSAAPRPSRDDYQHQATLLERIVPAAFTNMRCIAEPVETDFSLAQAICSYGYFSLAPNAWLPAEDKDHEDRGIFCRPLACLPTASEGTQRKVKSRYFQTRPGQPDLRQIVFVIVRQPQGQKCVSIKISSQDPLLPGTEGCVRAAIRRILRLDQNLEAWFACHPEAKHRGFGRTYRSPTVFEDMVKTVTNCNIKFKRTIDMNRLLCKEFGAGGIAFPDPLDLFCVSEEDLKKRGQVGYRAGRIIKLAEAFVQQQLTEEWFDDIGVPHAEVYNKLMGLYGFGKFAASNVMQLLGRYDPVVEAWDTENVRLMKELGMKGKSTEDFNRAARERYSTYHPYQFLAYWYELWLNYEARAGRISTRWSSQLFDEIL